MSNILITGAAGFIGSKTSQKLLENGENVVGVDNINDYYDKRLKHHRLKTLKQFPNFTFFKVNIENRKSLSDVFLNHKIDAIINLAARAGVRYSINNPDVYLTTNVHGTLNLLELMRKHGITKMVQASSSSLYAGQEMPFTEILPVNTPISPYAVTKKAAEILAYSYHYLFGLDISILRYFTVYGPAGRPDMSYFRFIKWIDEGNDLMLYGNGEQSRDFTYIDDIVDGTIKSLKPIGYEIINLGNNHPRNILELISIIEKGLNKKAKIKNMPMQKADAMATWADISKAKRLLGWAPKVSLEEGIERTIKWSTENRPLIKRIKIDLSV
ncbi:MAG: SDR family NAD(P)-dependent oxidoreductase [Deltaproteobacteria bacterium]|nr:SDR family NAD(P)-dependent oxidoreductase [Deltaproteobacteria bacterium]